MSQVNIGRWLPAGAVGTARDHDADAGRMGDARGHRDGARLDLRRMVGRAASGRTSGEWGKELSARWCLMSRSPNVAQARLT